MFQKPYKCMKPNLTKIRLGLFCVYSFSNLTGYLRLAYKPVRFELFGVFSGFPIS